MSNVVPLKRPQPRRLSRRQFHAEVKQLVAKGAVFVTSHLKRDHPERAISQAQIEKCLEVGTVQDDPWVNLHGNWQSTVFRHMAGEQLLVVVAIDWETQVIVITAY